MKTQRLLYFIYTYQAALWRCCSSRCYWLSDEAVTGEAVQAAIVLAEQLGDAPENAAAMERARALIPELQEKAQQ